MVVQETQAGQCYQLQGEMQGDSSSCVSLTDSVLLYRGEVSVQDRGHQGRKKKETEAKSHRASTGSEPGGLG